MADSFPRRFFLASLAASVATAAVDVEKLLWIPGAKTISIPAPPRFNSGVAIARNGERLAAFDYEASLYRAQAEALRALNAMIDTWNSEAMTRSRATHRVSRVLADG